MARGKPEIDLEACTGCEKWIDACPQKILKMSDNYNRRVEHFAVCFDEGRCIACVDCADICPEYAIRIWSFSITAGG